MSPSPELQLAVEAALAAGDAILDVYNRNTIHVERKQDASPVTEADTTASEIITRILETTGIHVLSEEGIHNPYHERRTWHRVWLVDPLDGTREFLKRNGEFTVNIALIHGTAPVLGVLYAPVTGTLYLSDLDNTAWTIPNARQNAATSIFDSAIPLPLPCTDRPFSIVTSRSHLDKRTGLVIESIKKEHPDLQILQVGSALKLAMIASGEADMYIRFGTTMEWDTAAGHALLNATNSQIVDMDTQADLHYNKEDLRNPSFIARTRT